MNLRKHIAKGYKAYNGAIITCQAHIDTYNAIQDNINTWITSGRDIPESLLIESHRHFVIMCDIAKN